MLNLKKEAEPIVNSEFKLGECPVCHSYVSHIYFMQHAETKVATRWYACSCGIVWQENKPTAVYDKAYHDKHAQFESKVRDCYEYPVRIYSPLIEELNYGRKVLLIGKQTPHQEEAFAKRGWVPYSIDLNPVYAPTSRMFIGNFESYDFGDLRFDMIWAYQTFECFTEPVASLLKIRELLTEDGILFLGTPDTDFIHTRGSARFRHWKPDVNKIMWNKRSLTKQLEQLGFNVVMARQNADMRFPETDDLHIIAQKKFF